MFIKQESRKGLWKRGSEGTRGYKCHKGENEGPLTGVKSVLERTRHGKIVSIMFQELINNRNIYIYIKYYIYAHCTHTDTHTYITEKGMYTLYVYSLSLQDQPLLETNTDSIPIAISLGCLGTYTYLYTHIQSIYLLCSQGTKLEGIEKPGI